MGGNSSDHVDVNFSRFNGMKYGTHDPEVRPNRLNRPRTGHKVPECSGAVQAPEPPLNRPRTPLITLLNTPNTLNT